MKGKLPEERKPTHREGGIDEWWVYGQHFFIGFWVPNLTMVVSSVAVLTIYLQTTH
jgi:hypothetical protein